MEHTKYLLNSCIAGSLSLQVSCIIICYICAHVLIHFVWFQTPHNAHAHGKFNCEVEECIDNNFVSAGTVDCQDKSCESDHTCSKLDLYSLLS